MSRRLIDKKNIKSIIKNTKSFTSRSHGLTIMRIMYGLVGVFALLILSIQATTGVMQADMTKATVDNLAISIIFIAGALALFTVFFMYFIFKLKKIILVSEFQNMLFAGAIRNKSDYCILLTENSEVIYMDEAAQKLFNINRKNYSNFSLGNLFDGESEVIKENFFNAVKCRVNFQLFHNVGGSKFSALLEPLKFAEGFLLLSANSV
ncbi:MAG: hypothetical protein HRK26_05055 [Rickettsiaceae bacterium H1]|nr:hypothetical protein [Rickettsiaceae bacterium H1]